MLNNHNLVYVIAWRCSGEVFQTVVWERRLLQGPCVLHTLHMAPTTSVSTDKKQVRAGK